ncbi:MAG: amidase [Terracidiphilus sp.]|jgi:aspartyl-tRNA(Asn)/glutamyl-tRNA(Gln) amidotransferase subunit A
MTAPSWTIRGFRAALAAGSLSPSQLAESALANTNRNASHNTYIWQDAAWTRAEACRVESMPHSSGGPFGDGRPTLWGIPVSVKDCFDLAGSPTSCGIHFYRDRDGVAAHDSWLVEQLRAAGAVIIGKTHLHPLAYGITGENPEYGDCAQPRDPGALTGGSSSGAAASVQESSAVAAIGTDTGGSVRAPAALCGLAGYRATLGRGDWRGGAHLAASFDTFGWLFRDLQDAPFLAVPFAPAQTAPTRRLASFAYVADSFLHDCEPDVVASFRVVIRTLQALGLKGRVIDTEWWSEAVEIFAPLQASEAARLHDGNFDRFEPAIRDRLKWGAGLASSEISALRLRHGGFRQRMDELFAAHQLILLPSIPVARLAVGADHSQTRARLLRYTAPFSLAGVPTIAIPCAYGGMQLAAARGNDESLLALAAEIGAHKKAALSD